MTNKKQEIIDTALRAFIENGYVNVPLKDIAEAVGIKQASIFYHFENKRALFETCAEVFFKRWSSWMTNLASGAGSLKELVYQTCMSLGMDNELVNELYGANTITGQYQFILDAAAIFPEAFKELSTSNQAYLEILNKKTAEAKQRKELRPEVEADVIYVLLGCLMEGSNIMRFTDPELDVRAYCDKMFDVVWHGIRNLDNNAQPYDR